MTVEPSSARLRREAGPVRSSVSHPLQIVWDGEPSSAPAKPALTGVRGGPAKTGGAPRRAADWFERLTGFKS